MRQDAEGDSMFVLISGQARVVLEPSGQEVAVIPAGGFFGEMSMLTGDRRSATVKAMDDVSVLEIAAKDFRELALANPGPARSRVDDHEHAADRPGRREGDSRCGRRARSEAELPGAHEAVPDSDSR